MLTKRAASYPLARIRGPLKSIMVFLVPIDSFDGMMLQLNSKLNYQLLRDKKIIEIAEQKAKRYRDQIENLQQKAGKERRHKKGAFRYYQENKSPIGGLLSLRLRSELDLPLCVILSTKMDSNCLATVQKLQENLCLCFWNTPAKEV